MWHGAVDDSIVNVPQSGRGFIDVLDDVAWRPGFGNVIAFRTADELLLFDTGNPYDADSLHQDLRRWSSCPVTTAVFSHGHIDHVSGTGPFDTEEGPELTVIAQESIGARFDRYLITNGYNAVINQRQFQLPGLTWPTEYRRPDVTYRDGMTVDRGDLTCELFHVKGETDDATVAWFPRRRILCPGDMFIWVAPNCGNPQKVQRYPREWALAMRRMAALGAEIMLPSHGAPVFGADRVRQALSDTAEWLESLVEQTLEGLNAGARLDELIHTVRPPGHLADRTYLRARYDEPEFIVRNLWRLYGGWYDGNPAHLKPAPEARLAAALAELAGGPKVLAEAARRHADSGDLRLAGHLAELAVLAEPEGPAVHRVRAEINDARAEAEPSLMAQGIFRWAAAESRRACAAENPGTVADAPAANDLTRGPQDRA